MMADPIAFASSPAGAAQPGQNQPAWLSPGAGPLAPGTVPPGALAHGSAAPFLVALLALFGPAGTDGVPQAPPDAEGPPAVDGGRATVPVRQPTAAGAAGRPAAGARHGADLDALLRGDDRTRGATGEDALPMPTPLPWLAGGLPQPAPPAGDASAAAPESEAIGPAAAGMDRAPRPDASARAAADAAALSPTAASGAAATPVPGGGRDANPAAPAGHPDGSGSAADTPNPPSEGAAVDQRLEALRAPAGPGARAPAADAAHRGGVGVAASGGRGAPRPQPVPGNDVARAQGASRDGAAPEAAPAPVADGTAAGAGPGAPAGPPIAGAQPAEAPATGAAAGAAHAPSPGRQVAAAVHVMTGPGPVTIRLHPAELGGVQVTIARGEGGAPVVSLSVEKAEALQAVRHELPALHAALDRIGVPQDGRELVLRLAPPEAADPDAGGGAATGGFQGGDGGRDAPRGDPWGGAAAFGQGQGGGGQGGNGEAGGGAHPGGDHGRRVWPGVGAPSDLGAASAAPPRWARFGVDITA